MSRFDNFDPISGPVPYWPFFELGDVASEARILMAGMSIGDVLDMERALDDALYRAREDWVERELEGAVKRILKTSSWELQYLPDGRQATEANLRWLLENWPIDADDEPDLLVEDDISDIMAFRAAIYTGVIPCENESEHSYEVRLACVLALMHISSCLEVLSCPEEDLGIHEDGPIAARLISAANSAMTAALALGIAREMAAENEMSAYAADDLDAAIEKARQQFAAERAQKAAMARHGPSKLAIQFVQSEWAMHAKAYGYNKTDFARTYVGLIRNKFKTKGGDPFDVKIETITDIWLPRSASKPATQPVDGE